MALLSKLALLSSLAVLTAADHIDDKSYILDETILGTKLPKALSDHTATLDKTRNQIYVVGGCDSPNGNAWVQERGQFECGRLSKSVYVFDVATSTFTTLADMPFERYRHAAAYANNKLFVHGGRTVADDIITDLLIYDVLAGTWTNITLASEYQLSDHTAWSYLNYTYFSGGYHANYTTVGTTFRINAATTVDAATLDLENVNPMLVPRGDVAAASTDSYALVAGGFTDANGFCEPHVHAEEFSFATQSWTQVANMSIGGAERVLVALTENATSKIFALGGERQVIGFCEMDVKPEPGERTIPLQDVERFDRTPNHWTTLPDLPQHRFRFPAVGINDTVYTFGGQVAHQDDCNCFRTTDTIILYKEELSAGFTAFGASSSSLWLILSVVGALWMTLLW